MTQPFPLPPMTEAQRTAFVAQYRSLEKDELTGVLLAVFLGGFGVHHFYLNRPGTGLIFLLFSWTGLTYPIAWVEAFFMPGRVRRFNTEQAAYLAAFFAGSFLAQPALPPSVTLAGCPGCGVTANPAARFCAHCGAPLGG